MTTSTNKNSPTEIISDFNLSKLSEVSRLACIQHSGINAIFKRPKNHAVFLTELSSRGTFCKPEEFNLRKHHLNNKLECVSYHLDNYLALESAIIEGLKQIPLEPKQSNRTIGISTTKLTAEFEAYEIQFDASLEYYARLLNYYFKIQDTEKGKHKLSNIKTHIQHQTEWKENTKAQKIMSCLDTAKSVYEEYQSGMSRRDQIVHRQGIETTTLNLASKSNGEFIIFKVSSNKAIPPNMDGENALSQRMNQNFDTLLNMIQGTLTALYGE